MFAVWIHTTPNLSKNPARATPYNYLVIILLIKILKKSDYLNVKQICETSVVNLKFIIQINQRLFEVNYDFVENEIRVYNDDKDLLGKFEYPKGLWRNPHEDSAEYYLLKCVS